MAVSGIGSATPAASYTPPPVKTTAVDGDSPAVESMETRAAKLAEKLNGGYAPKAKIEAATGQFNAVEGKGLNIDKTA